MKITNINGVDVVKTGDLSAELGIGNISVDTIKSLGFTPHGNEGNAKLWRVDQVNDIIDALCAKLNQARRVR